MRILEGLGIDGSRSHVGSLCDIEQLGKIGHGKLHSETKKVAISSFSMPQEGTALTLPGACSGPGGKLIVTDMDRIEAS